MEKKYKLKQTNQRNVRSQIKTKSTKTEALR